MLPPPLEPPSPLPGVTAAMSVAAGALALYHRRVRHNDNAWFGAVVIREAETQLLIQSSLSRLCKAAALRSGSQRPAAERDGVLQKEQELKKYKTRFMARTIQKPSHTRKL